MGDRPDPAREVAEQVLGDLRFSGLRDGPRKEAMRLGQVTHGAAYRSPPKNHQMIARKAASHRINTLTSTKAIPTVSTHPAA